MDSSSLASLFNRHALGIALAGVEGFLSMSGASAAHLFDQRLDLYIGGRK